MTVIIFLRFNSYFYLVTLSRTLLILLFLVTTIFSTFAMAATSHVTVEKSAKGWRLLVDQKPYIVKGVCYEPTQIGESKNDATQGDWMLQDVNRNGLIDSPYESWVDRNNNNRQDADEPVVGDFRLLQQLGANTIRIYHHASDRKEIKTLHDFQTAQRLYNHPPNKALLRDLFNSYGIRVAMGDLLGAYAVASGASWEAGTDYRDPMQRARMLRSVEAMVSEFKDEPYILMWILGNENRFGSSTHTNAAQHPKAYAKFVNEVAKRIHDWDPHHPVVSCDLDIPNFKAFTDFMPDVDIYGTNSYRTPGFGSLWQQIADNYDKPVLITEFGISIPRITQGVLDENYHASVYQKGWEDISAHTAMGSKSPANAIGGFVYEWMDNWWQDGDPLQQNMKTSWNHEICGLVSQGDGEHSPFLRQIRKSYEVLHKLWASD